MMNHHTLPGLFIVRNNFCLPSFDSWLFFVLLTCSEKQKSDFECGDVDAFMGSMPALERALLGFMCKEIIDVGRLLWLRDQGMKAELVKYVPSSVSPENHLLLAKMLP